MNRSFADSFSNLPDCITKATLRIRLRANRDIERNDTIMLAFAGTGGVLDPNRWSSYIGAGNAGPGVLNYTWLATNVAELVLDLGRLPLGNNQYKDLIPTLCAKKYLDLYVQDDTSVDFAILSIESCRCRQDIVLCAPPGQPCATVTYATPAFTDLCCPNMPGSLRVTCTPASGTCFPIGTNAVHCTAIDAAGRRARCCFRVIVLQGNPPVFSSCPTNITTNVCSSSMALIYPMPVVTGGTLLGCTPSSGSTFNSGTTMVACTASNVCGTATCSFTVTVIADTTPPVITGPCVTNLFEASVAAPSTGVVRRLSAAGINCMKGLTNCAQDCFFAHTFANLPSSITSAKLTVRLKPCGGAGWTDTLGLYFINAAGASLPGGWSRLIGSGGGGGSDLLPNDWDTYTSGHTFTFDLGNMPLGGANLLPYMNQHGFVDFIVQDDTAVESLTLEVVSCGCGDTRLVECGTPWTFGIPTAFDARCGTNVTLTSVVVGSGNACSNVNTIVWTATDCCGNSTTCTQRVVVVDTTPPVVGSGAGGGGAVLDESFDPGSISFASGVAPNAAISQIFKVGSSGTLVQLDLWIARASINLTHDLLIELRDVLVTGEPDLGGPARASVTASWATIPTGYNWMSFTFAPGAAVTAGETLAIVLRDPVVSADANTTYGLAGAYFPFATYPDGDAYYTYLPTVSWTPYGVGSYDYAFRTYLASSGGCATNKTVECGSPWTFDAPAVFDACCGTNVTPTYTTVTNGNCPQSITRSWRATDCCGNSADCTQTVTVMDTTPPVLRCPEAIKITTCSNSVPVYYRVLATDNCDANVLVNCTPPSGSPFNSGTTLVHCTAVDDCGNTNSCLFPVVISTTPTWQLFAAGARDCYASPNELAARSACLTTAYPGALWKNFDDPTVNRFFGHSWTLPNVTYFDGYLVTRMKDFNCSGISQNDTISLGLLNCSPATWGWSRHLGPDGADPGLQPASWCGISNCNHLFNLHLSALPAFPSGTTTVLPLINSTSPRRFDMFVQDDTRVDFANLWLRRCPPQHIIGGLEATLTNAVIAYGSNSWSLIADPQLASPVSYGASLSLGYTDGAALTLGTAALTQSSNGAVSVQLRSFMPNGGTHSLGFLGTNGVDGQFFVTPTASSAPGGSTLTLRNHGVTVLTQTYGPGVLPANCSLIANQLVAPSFTFQGGTNATMRLPSTTAVSGAFGTFQADEIAISVADSSTWIRGFCPYAVDVTATGVAEVSLSQIQIGATGIIDPADGQHDDWFATVSGDALARVENGQLTLSALDAAGSSTMFFDVQLDTSVAGGGTNEFRATIQTSFGQFSPVPNNASLRFRPAFEDAIVDPADGQHDDWVAISCHISTNGQDWDISATLSNAPLAFTSVEVLNNGSNVITVANPATVSVSELPGVYWPTTSWFVDADTCHRFPYPAGVTVFINGTPHFGNELRVLTATDTQFTGFTGLRVQTTGAEALVLTGFETGPVLYQLESPIIVGSDIVIRANTLGGVIECSPSLTGPWTIVPTESGEVRVSTTNAPAKFFRVRGN